MLTVVVWQTKHLDQSISIHLTLRNTSCNLKLRKAYVIICSTSNRSLTQPVFLIKNVTFAFAAANFQTKWCPADGNVHAADCEGFQWLGRRPILSVHDQSGCQALNDRGGGRGGDCRGGCGGGGMPQRPSTAANFLAAKRPVAALCLSALSTHMNATGAATSWRSAGTSAIFQIEVITNVVIGWRLAGGVPEWCWS